MAHVDDATSPVSTIARWINSAKIEKWRGENVGIHYDLILLFKKKREFMNIGESVYLNRGLVKCQIPEPHKTGIEL